MIQPMAGSAVHQLRSMAAALEGSSVVPMADAATKIRNAAQQVGAAMPALSAAVTAKGVVLQTHVVCRTVVKSVRLMKSLNALNGRIAI